LAGRWLKQSSFLGEPLPIEHGEDCRYVLGIASSQQSQCPEGRLALAANHQVMDGDAGPSVTFSMSSHKGYSPRKMALLV
jgi:hypothetical protein